MNSSKITIIAFGLIAEKIGQKSREMPVFEHSEILRQHLLSEFPELNKTPFSIAVNRKIVTSATALHAGDEIALLPPFSGG
jgi:molybdopterin converting factor small subunit